MSQPEPPPTMRAVVLTGHGGLDRLEYREDWPTPGPGSGEVLIKVGACGLNNTDINALRRGGLVARLEHGTGHVAVAGRKARSRPVMYNADHTPAEMHPWQLQDLPPGRSAN